MMKEMNSGKEPTQGEVEFIMRMGRSPQPPLEALGLKNFTLAVEAWDAYVKEFQELTGEDSIKNVFAFYDKDNTGKLDFYQLKELMTDLEGGRTRRSSRLVTDIDVEWLMSKADVLNDGQLSGKEFQLALCAWYQYLVRFDEEVIGFNRQKGDQKQCCAVS